jgi:HD-GYP domain-containing protein (c-di-GMP phosphodiesterase class II)
LVFRRAQLSLGGVGMSEPRSLLRRLRLRHVLFLLLLLSGIIPLATGNLLLMRQNRDILETQEKTSLTRSAEALSRELSGDLEEVQRRLREIGGGLLAVPGPASTEERLRQRWVAPYVQGLMQRDARLQAMRVLDLDGVGLRFTAADLPPTAGAALDAAFEEARRRRTAVQRFVVLPGDQPAVALAVPIADERGAPRLVVEALARLRLMEAVFHGVGGGDRQEQVFLVDADGRLLWSAGAARDMRRAVASSNLVRDFARYPLNLTAEYSVVAGGRRQRLLGRVSPVPAAGWGVVVQKPAAAAFEVVERMVVYTAVSTAMLVVVALLFAVFAARRVAGPIQRLAATTKEIAAGNFGRRLDVAGLGAEIDELAHDFNRMSDHVQSYVEQLRQAAMANRELFISSIRALAAAIDAKDPYTRGHSERVAALSRTIARHLALGEDFQGKVWIGALLHDVGKIGIDDRILKKGGVLTGDEYELMKLHPVIGAEIMSPIDQLREMIPAIRWHHENWNGRGYPDGLRGEEIPLIARIVSVADCFDAITTSRPYQRAYTPAFAVETITKLTGSRFDAKVVTAFLRAFEAGDIQVGGEAGAREAVAAGGSA